MLSFGKASIRVHGMKVTINDKDFMSDEAIATNVD